MTQQIPLACEPRADVVGDDGTHEVAPDLSLRRALDELARDVDRVAVPKQSRSFTNSTRADDGSAYPTVKS